MLFGQLNLHALQNFLVVTLEGGVEDTVTVNDDESELLVVLQQGLQGLGVETILALVGENSLRLEGLQVKGDLLVGLAILELDDTTEEDQTVGRGLLVQLQLCSKEKVRDRSRVIGDLLSLVEVMAARTDWRV